MLDAYRPVSLLTALWPTQEFDFPCDLGEFGRRMREQFPVFEEMHQVQSGGATLPPELPQIVFMGQARQWTLELAPAKLTLRRAVPQPIANAEMWQAMRAQLLAIVAWLAELHSFRAYRQGLLLQLFRDTRSSATEKLAQYFIQPRALAGQPLHELNLGMLTRQALADGTMVNRWLRFQPLRTVDARHVDFAAQVEIDINSFPEDSRPRTAVDVAAFLDAAREHIDAIAMLNDPELFA